MTIEVHVESAWPDGEVPDAADFSRWVKAALAGQRDNGEVAIRIVGADEGTELNHRYRDREGPTNVLSFPAEIPSGIDMALVGDLAICAPVVIREAGEQGKPVAAHWAHLTVHGTLHLIGFDHQDDAEAAVMEAMETRILAGLGFPDPYWV